MDDKAATTRDGPGPACAYCTAFSVGTPLADDLTCRCGMPCGADRCAADELPFTEERLLRLEEAMLGRFTVCGDLYRFARFGQLAETAVDPHTAATLDELRTEALLSTRDDGTVAVTQRGLRRLDTWETTR